MKYINLDKYGKQTDPFYFSLEKHLLTLSGDFSFIWDVYPAVIIGKHQVAKQEVNLDYLKANDIYLFRRPSGGGAVYSDEGCIKYTFISRNKTKDEMYEQYLKVIQNFLKTYGLDAVFSGRNDLLVDGYKFSGNAYYQTKDGNVLHGTILYDTNMEKLSQVLTPSVEKLSSKGVKSVKSRVINLVELIKISRQEFVRDFKNFLNHNETFLTVEEELIIDDYQKDFNSNDYIYGLEPKYQNIKSQRFPYGEVIINYQVDKGKIINIKILGDFFEQDDIQILEQSLLGQDINDLQVSKVNQYIDNMSDEDFLTLMKG